MDQLESFLAKKETTHKASDELEKVSSDEDEKEVEEEDESEEVFDSTLNLNIIDLMHLGDQVDQVKLESGLLSEIGEEVIELENYSSVKENSTFDQVINEHASIDESQIENLFENSNLGEIEKENFTTELLSKLTEEGIELDNETHLDNLFKSVNLEEFEQIPLVEKESYLMNELSAMDETLEVIKNESLESIFEIGDAETTVIPSESEVPNLEDLHFNRHIEVNNSQDDGIEEFVSMEQTESISEQEIIESESQIKVEEPIDEVSNNQKNFEPVNRMPVIKEANSSIQKVVQEDFVSTIETLIIEETESTSPSDKVTTARIQLTPDRLGKVDLQIEIKGKELTVKLIVEQKETKEWMDQQLTQLKEKLFTQEMTVKDFQIIVDEDSLNNQFMSNEDNPFFKQKEKDSQERKKQGLTKNKEIDSPIKSEAGNYSGGNGISLLV